MATSEIIYPWGMMSSESRNAPTVFISYAWEDDSHRKWVHDLASRLRFDGVDAKLDQWELVPGDRLPEFMERSVRENDFVLIICTPKYREKADGRLGGVGYEGDIMVAEVLSRGNHRKFIPVLRRGSFADAIPSWASGKFYIDLSATPLSERDYQILLDTLHGMRKQPPPLGQRQGATVSLIQVKLEINSVGDGHMDVVYRIPLTREPYLQGGWRIQGETLVRDIKFLDVVPQRRKATHLLVTPLVDWCKAYPVLIEEQINGSAQQTIAVRVEVPLHWQRDGGAPYVSFGARFHGDYFVSRAHVRRVGRQFRVPGLADGQETVIVTTREQTERLELSVHPPFMSEACGDLTFAEFSTYTQGADGELHVSQHHRDLRPFIIERHSPLRYLVVSVDQPLKDVGYAVMWRLPEEASGEAIEQENEDEHALAWAERIRIEMLRVSVGKAPVLARYLGRTLQGLMDALIEANAASRQDRLIWIIYVPEGQLGRTREEGVGKKQQILRPVLASFPQTDPRWNLTWDIGKGIVGKAYAMDVLVRYIKNSGQVERASKLWADADQEYVPAIFRASALYALPLHVPTGSKVVVWGVLCVGAEADYPQLNLDVPLPISELAPGPRSSDAAIGLVRGLYVVTRNLIASIAEGRDLADQL